MLFRSLHKLHILPKKFLKMGETEKAFVIAAIKIKIENDKKKEKEIRQKAKKKGG